MSELLDNFNTINASIIAEMNSKLKDDINEINNDFARRGLHASGPHFKQLQKLLEEDIKKKNQAIVENISKFASQNTAKKLIELLPDIKKSTAELLQRVVVNNQRQLENFGKRIKFPYVPKLRITSDNEIKVMNAKIDLLFKKYDEISLQDNKSTNSKQPFIDKDRLKDLNNIKSEEYDLKRLIRLCEEINICYEYDCYSAVAALTRALLDHVPPIFECKSFSEVANNYKGSKSFKDNMVHLEKVVRKIADSHLHIQIRNKEILPSDRQVNSSQEVDVLLAEIIRILS